MTIPEITHRLDVYDTAVLAGGPFRLVDTVLVALIEDGRLRVDPSGEFRVTVPPGRHPVEAAALDAVGSPGHRSVDTIRGRLVRDPRLAEVFQRLTDDGLIRRTLLSRLVGRTDAYTTTAAGRSALWQLTEEPEVYAGNAGQVALHGREGLTDRRLRAEIFGRPPAVLPPGISRRRSRTVEPATPGSGIDGLPGGDG